jgi:hypothetical protein
MSGSASPPIHLSTIHFSKRQYLKNIKICSLTIHSPLIENRNQSRIKLALPTLSRGMKWEERVARMGERRGEERET